MAFIQGGFNAGQNPFINQFPTSFGAPAFGGAQQSFGFNPQQAQMMFMLQALMQAMQQMSQGWGGFAGGGGQQVPQVAVATAAVVVKSAAAVTAAADLKDFNHALPTTQVFKPTSTR